MMEYSGMFQVSLFCRSELAKQRNVRRAVAPHIVRITEDIQRSSRFLVLDHQLPCAGSINFSKQHRERRYRQHVRKVAYREDSTIAVADDWAKGIVDSCPTEPAQHSDERHTSQGCVFLKGALFLGVSVMRRG
jgi:hypothetical protein